MIISDFISIVVISLTVYSLFDYFVGSLNCKECKKYPKYHVSKLLNQIHVLESDIGKFKQENILLLNQIQELKAINNYQTIELEQNIAVLQTENDSLKQQLECSQREVSTLSGVLNSEPIMEALGKKDE